MTSSTTGAAPAARQPVPHLLDGAHLDGSELYVGSEVPALGDVVWVRLRVPSDAPEGDVLVRVVKDGEPGYVAATPDGRSAGERWYSADVEVHNPVALYRFVLPHPDGYRWLNGTGEHARDIQDLHDFRLSVHGGAPRWARSSVVYQIFPDRFARSGTERPEPAWAVPADWDDPVIGGKEPETPLQYYGGDLLGVEQRLDYLADLGAGIVYLTPIFPGESNHRYNATTFDHVDPLLGGDEALASLARAVHRRGMHLIGDFTTNHTGDTHEWFQRAMLDRHGTEHGYYCWHEKDPATSAGTTCRPSRSSTTTGRASCSAWRSGRTPSPPTG